MTSRATPTMVWIDSTAVPVDQNTLPALAVSASFHSILLAPRGQRLCTVSLHLLASSWEWRSFPALMMMQLHTSLGFIVLAPHQTGLSLPLLHTDDPSRYESSSLRSMFDGLLQADAAVRRKARTPREFSTLTGIPD